MGQGQDDEAALANSNRADYGVRLKIEHLSGAEDFGIKIGDVRVRRHSGQWKLERGATTLTSNYPMKEEWIMIASDKALLFYADGRQVFTHIFSTQISGELKLYTGEPGTTVTFDDVLTFYDPVISIAYLDGSGKERQRQLLDGVNTIASETVYDNIGRAAISTKPGRYDNSLPGYRANFVTAMNWNSGVMSGDVAAKNPADNGFPYSRTVFEDAPTSRAVETGRPGQVFAIGQGHTATVQYGKNVSGDGFMDHLPAGKYFMKTTTDQNGAVSKTLTDKTGRAVARTAEAQLSGQVKVPASLTVTQEQGNNAKSFLAKFAQQVSYSGSLAGEEDYFYIGTTPGGSDVVSITSPGPFSGAFDAASQQTYYIKIREDIPTESGGSTAQVDYLAWGSGSFYPVTSYEYDDWGNLTRIYPPNYHNIPHPSHTADDYITGMEYDFLGRMNLRKTSDGGTTRYIYDPAGRLRFRMDAEGEAQNPDHISYRKYDVLGRTIEEGYIADTNWGDGSALQNYADTDPTWPATPATWRKKFTYDGDGAMPFMRGRLHKVLTNNNSAIEEEVEETFTYDIYGNVVQKQMRVIDYDIITYTTVYEFNHAGSVAKITYLPVDLVLQNGNISATTGWEALNSITAGPAFTIENGANVTMQAGNRITLSPGFTAQQGSQFHASIGGPGGDPQAGEVVYTYNRLGQVESVGRPGQPEFYASYTYNPDGSLAAETLNNGGSTPITRSYSYNSPGWLTGLDSDFGSSYFNQAIDYIENGYGGAGYYNGNIARATFAYNWTGAPAGYTVQFQYDNLNQLQVADHNLAALNNFDIGVGAGNETVYDANGNILEITVGSSTKTYAYYPGSNKVQNTDGSGNDYTYDANGNITVSTPKNLSGLSYDPFTQMTQQITTNASEQIGFEYSGTNQRVLKTFDDQTDVTNILYLHGQNAYPLMEKSKAGAAPETRIIYIYGPTGLLAMQKEGGVYYVLKDHLGSTRVVVDETGTVAAYFDYAPFGGIMRSGVNTDIAYRYTGQEFDAESGLHNFRARLYDDELLRFYAVDPAGQFASPFIYAGNNPVVYVDPDGEFVPLAVLAGAVLIGGTVNVIANWNQIDNFWEGLSYFAIGGGSGALSTLGPGGWLAAGALSGAGNTALQGGNASAIAQGAFIGGISGLVGGAAGQWASKAGISLALQGLHVNSPLIGGALGGAFGGFAGGFAAEYRRSHYRGTGIPGAEQY